MCPGCLGSSRSAGYMRACWFAYLSPSWLHTLFQRSLNSPSPLARGKVLLVPGSYAQSLDGEWQGWRSGGLAFPETNDLGYQLCPSRVCHLPVVPIYDLLFLASFSSRATPNNSSLT